MEVLVNKTSYQRGKTVSGSQTPTDTYRCPVSSPNAAVEAPRPIANSQLGFMTDRASPLQRGSLLVTYKTRHRNVGKLGSLMTPRSRNMDYYYVNSQSQSNADKQIASPWVNSLCAQPVEEIFGKYKKQFEMQRMKQLWTKTFTTPGEKALLDVWMKNESKKSSNQKTESRKTKSSASFSSKSDRKSLHKSSTSPMADVRESPPLHNTPESDKFYLGDDFESDPHPPTPQPTAIEIPQAVPENEIIQRLDNNSALSRSQSNLNLVVGSDFYEQFKRQNQHLPTIKSSRIEVHTSRQYMSADQFFPSVLATKTQRESRPFTPAKRYRHKLRGKSPKYPLKNTQLVDNPLFGETRFPQLTRDKLEVIP